MALIRIMLHRNLSFQNYDKQANEWDNQCFWKYAAGRVWSWKSDTSCRKAVALLICSVVWATTRPGENGVATALLDGEYPRKQRLHWQQVLIYRMTKMWVVFASFTENSKNLMMLTRLPEPESDHLCSQLYIHYFHHSIVLLFTYTTYILRSCIL